MHHSCHKVWNMPLNEQAFTKTSLLKLLKDVGGVTLLDIGHEGTDIVYFFSSEEDFDKLLSLHCDFIETHHFRLNFPRQYLAARFVIISELSYVDRGTRHSG